MTAPTIRREITRDVKGGTIRYVNSWCTACNYWHAFEFTLEQAYLQGERHLMNVHDVDARTASTARRQHEHKTTDREVCPQPCEHLSQHDAREGRTCPEHPCTCTDREDGSKSNG